MSIEPGEELLWKYINGDCTPSEISFIESWINSSNENKGKFERIRFYLNTIHSENSESENLNRNNAFESKGNYKLAIVIIILVLLMLGFFYAIKNKFMF